MAVLTALVCAVGASNALAAAPVASLGVPSGAIVPNAPIHFDGSKSTASSPATIVQYRWTVGPHGVVTTNTSSRDDPGLVPGTYTVSLVVVDSNGDQSAAATKQITVDNDHFAPTASLAVPTSVAPGAAIHLVGSNSSDVGGHVVQYRWTVATRPPVVTAAATFDAPGLGTGVYSVSLVVVDDSGNQSTADTKQLVVGDPFVPTAVLQVPATIAPGAAIHLVGSKSFDTGGGNVVQYRWTVAGRPPVTTVDPTFDAPGLGTGVHQVSLVVVDDSGNQSSAADVQITVGDPFAPTPVLEAPAFVGAAVPIHLVGSKSFDTGGGSVVQYRWTVGTRPVVVTADPTFDAPGLGIGVYQVSLVVIDDSGNESAPTSVQIHVVDTTAPTAVLDGPGSVVTGTAIHLTAFKSFDVGGSVVQYRWTVAGRPAVVTTGPSFDAPSLSAGAYQASLVVVDDSGNQSAPAIRTFSVTPDATPVTKFGKITLFAPVNKKTSQIFLRTRTLLAGRVFAPAAGRLSATFTLKRGGKTLKLGSTSLSLKAGDVKQLKIKLGSSALKALRGHRKVTVVTRASIKDGTSNTLQTVTRSVTFTVNP